MDRSSCGRGHGRARPASPQPHPTQPLGDPQPPADRLPLGHAPPGSHKPMGLGQGLQEVVVQLDEAEPAEDLLTMEGMDKHLALVLASKGICTMEDLAEQSIDDLLDLENMTEEKAAELIMTARKPWFEGNV